jgi:hypothetical protein
MSQKTDQRRQKLMPGGIPRWIRCYDNGGGFPRFCRKCLHFSLAEMCDVNQCGHKTIKVEEGGTFDRYTVVFTGNYPGRGGRCDYVSMSRHPTHPQGFGQHGECDRVIDCPAGGFPPTIGDVGPLGRRITFQRLPPDCQSLVVRDYFEMWGLGVVSRNQV